jgi:hypothetical protein
MKTTARLTPKNSTIHRLRVHGYCNISDTELSKLAFGNRFAYLLCSSILAVGVVTANIPILSLMMFVAFFGIILPYHPFDYIYNQLLHKSLGKPKLPPRSRQIKIACTIATVWLAATIYLFYSGLFLAGYIAGGPLFSVVFLVSTTHICIPSMIFNFLFKYKVEQ